MMHQLHLLIRQKEEILKKRKILNANIENNGVYALNIADGIVIVVAVIIFIAIIKIHCTKNEVFH